MRADATAPWRFPPGDGEAARLIAAFDWSRTALGPIDGWPQSLRTMTGFMILSTVPMVLLWGDDGTMIYNDAYATFAGNRHPALLGSKVREGWAEVAGFNDHVMAVGLAGGTLAYRDQELTLARRGRPETVWLDLDYSPVADESGRPAGVIAIVAETTDRVLAEKALRALNADLERQVGERTHLLGRTWQVNPDMLGVASRAGYFEQVNPAWEVTLGWPVETVKTTQFLKFLHPDDLAAGRDAYATLLRGEPVLRLVNRWRRVDGSYCWLSWVWVPEDDKLYCSARDISAEREAADALALSQASLRAIFETSFQFQGVVDRDGILRDMNATALDAVGASLAEVVGQPFADTPWFSATPGMPQTVREFIAAALRGEATRTEFTVAMPGGLRTFDFAMRPMRDAAGTIVGAVPEAADITKRRAAEEALRQTQKLDAMGQLTGGVAHDFNNLLTPIIASLDLLQRRGRGDAREQRLIAGALQSADRAKMLVQRLLAFARRQPLQPVAVDVGRLVADMADLVATTSGPRIIVVVDAATDVPAATADPNQLEMAILNLAVNARDAMPDGGTLTIAAAGDTLPPGHRSGLLPGDYVRLTVTDTGGGMDAATLARAVEPFFSTKGVGKGTGLGLSMVHGLAAQLDGALVIASRKDGGTTVELWLPVASGPAVAPAVADPVEPLRMSGTVLVVDDEDIVRTSTADMLGELGFTVLEATSAEEALRALGRGTAIDLLVTDHLMPGMTGVELVRAARDLRPALPVLLVSGFAEADSIDPALPRLTKPFRHAELAASIAGLTGGTA